MLWPIPSSEPVAGWSLRSRTILKTNALAVVTYPFAPAFAVPIAVALAVALAFGLAVARALPLPLPLAFALVVGLHFLTTLQ